MYDPVTVVSYDPEWPYRFEREVAVLRAVFAGADAVIEHIGSTAVPGLVAKPVIDVMIGLQSLAEADSRIAAFEGACYEYVRKYERELPERRYFRKPRLRPRTCHVHCVVLESDFWIRHLAFRDYLRAHPESAAAYDELKRALAVRVSKAEYTDAKSPFIERILAAALGHDGQRTAQQQRSADGAVRRG